MREARIGKDATEAPIEYFLVQDGSEVLLRANAGEGTETLLLLYPHQIRKVAWVPRGLGLEMEPGTNTIQISTGLRKD